MPDSLKDEQWRQVLELAQAVADLPKHERHAFLESSDSSPEVIQQVLVLVNQFEVSTGRPIEVGAKVDHFLITGRIGEGGMGEVYSARDTELERVVALKFLHPEALGRPDAAERMIREARTASALNHPNIVTVYEVVRAESTVGIVMEFVDGLPLRHLQTERLPLELFLDIARQIADALAAAHAASIVHRDIKPENVILRPNRQVKVLDFGLARQIKAGQTMSNGTFGAGMPAGTWRYMSPEQCRGETLTGASDIFSLGLVLYELSTGHHPFHADSAFETMQAIATQEPAAPSRRRPDIPAGLDALILSMLAKTPAERPAAVEVEQRLTGLQHFPTSQAPAIRDKPIRRRKRWSIAAAAFVGIAATLGAVYWKQQGQEKTAASYEVTSLVAENRATAAAISLDGKFSAYANADGLFLRASQSGETTPLHAPDSFLVDQIAWFPDGTKLLASGSSTVTNRPSAWTVFITGKSPRLVRMDARSAVPSPDGKQIAYSNYEQSEIWVAGANGEEPRKIVGGPGDDAFPSIVWSADGRYLIFQRRHYSGSQDLGFVMRDRFYERSLESVKLDSLQITSKLSSFWLQSAFTLASGEILCLTMDKTTGNSNEFWLIKIDPATGTFGPPRKMPNSPESAGFLTNLSATADGKQLMALHHVIQSAVFVADYQSSPPKFLHPRRLTLDAHDSYPHAWTADSSSVIFESNRTGSWDLYQQRLDRRTPETITGDPGKSEVLAQLAMNGRALLYDGSPEHKSGANKLMRVPIEGGTPQEVPTDGKLDQFRCGTGPKQPCVLRKTVERQYYVYYDLDPVTGIGQELARTSWIPGVVGDWDIAPDGSSVAIPKHDTRQAQIRVISLHPNGKDPKEREINLAGLTDLEGLIWAVDGTGWFVSLNTPAGRRMVYAYLDGKVLPLANIHGWAVPSPDGKRVAYLDRVVVANAWAIDRR